MSSTQAGGVDSCRRTVPRRTRGTLGRACQRRGERRVLPSAGVAGDWDGAPLGTVVARGTGHRLDSDRRAEKPGGAEAGAPRPRLRLEIKGVAVHPARTGCGEWDSGPIGRKTTPSLGVGGYRLGVAQAVGTAQGCREEAAWVRTPLVSQGKAQPCGAAATRVRTPLGVTGA